MTLLTRGDHKVAEHVDDLRTWLQQLPTPQPVTETAVLSCARHGDDIQTWTYVEADATEGVARRRCLSCAHSVGMLDSEDRWTFPPMWACLGCGHSIAELAAGMHVDPEDQVSWVALGARCVECGRVSGLTDLVLPGLPVADVIAAL
jgi:hypothetical protein